MPRPPSDTPWHQWKVTLPAALAGRVEFALFNPIYQKPDYGARSRLIAILLQKWLDELPPEVRTEQGVGLVYLMENPQ